MVDDSIDVDKLLIRTWHTLPADLRDERGGHTWVTGEDGVDVDLGLREGKTRVRDEGDFNGLDMGVILPPRNCL